jgi:hypothetical protein
MVADSSLLSLDLSPTMKESDGNDPNARTAAGVGLSAVGVGVSMAEGRSLCG